MLASAGGRLSAGFSNLTALAKEKAAAIREHFPQQNEVHETPGPKEAPDSPPKYEVPAAENDPPPEAGEKEKKKNRLFLWLFLSAVTLVLILIAVIVLKNMDSGPSGQEDPSSGNRMEQTEDTTPQPTTQEKTTPAPTDPPTEATVATTPAPTTEAPTEASVEEFFEGVWQGSDANVTTIEIHRDHTLYYRELNNKKIKTVEGSRGTWAADDKESIRITLPRLGNGYELKGTVREDGSFLLQCLNGQPWSDEIVRRSSISLEEIDRIVEERLRGMMEDGRYEFGLYPYHYTCKWEKPNEILTVTRKEDGRYFRILPDRIETTFPFFDENYNEHNAEGVKKTVSFAKDCSYYYYELRERTDYYQNVREMQNLIKNYFDNGSDWLPILYVREGEITTFAYEAY